MSLNPNLDGATFATTVGALTGTGAETVYDTTAIINYAIGGKGYTKAAVTDGATPTADGDPLLATSHNSCIRVDASGTRNRTHCNDSILPPLP